MYSQTYDDEAPIPLIANYTVVKEGEEEEKREVEDRVILEIGRQDDKPREEHTFSHKKYDKTISHHRSYVLEDYEPRRISYFRPHELEQTVHDGKTTVTMILVYIGWRPIWRHSGGNTRLLRKRSRVRFHSANICVHEHVCLYWVWVFLCIKCMYLQKGI
jgi:hypothetical protein